LRSYLLDLISRLEYFIIKNPHLTTPEEFEAGKGKLNNQAHHGSHTDVNRNSPRKQLRGGCPSEPEKCRLAGRNF